MEMYSGVLERVRRIEQKNNIVYAKEDGKLYKTIKVLFILAFAYGIGVNLLYLLGMLLQYSGKLAEYAKYFITPAVCTALITAGFVFFLKKFHFTSCCLTVVPATILIFFFKPLLEDELTLNSVQPKYYWRHLAPMLLIIILIIWGSVIAIRAKKKTRDQYNRVCTNLYNLYKINVTDGGDLTEEQWDEFLRSYDPHNYKPQFLNKPQNEEQSEENQS